MKKSILVLLFFVFAFASAIPAQTPDDRQQPAVQPKPLVLSTNNSLVFNGVTNIAPQNLIPNSFLAQKLIEMKGILREIPVAAESDINPNPVIYKASLFDMDGRLIAKLQSPDNIFAKCNDKYVYVSGYQVITPILNTRSVSMLMIAPFVPVINVKEIKIIYHWIEKKGIIGAVNAIHVVGEPYRANLYDDSGKLIARLQSRTIPLPQYDKMIVYVAGFDLPVPIVQGTPITDTTNSITMPPLVPSIDVQRIKVIAKWVEIEGLCKAKTSTDSVSPVHTGKLYDKNESLIALLYSYEIPLYKYDGFVVQVAGYQYLPVLNTPADTDNGIADRLRLSAVNEAPLGVISSVPVIDVRKITIVYVPPPVEVWKGIAYPNDNQNPYGAYAPYTLKTPDGEVIGLLTTNSKYISSLLMKYKIDFVIAVAGPVKELENSTLPVKIKIMDIEKLVVLEDLRHIIWMSGEPLKFRVGEKINFNKIGNIKWRGFAFNTDKLDSSAPESIAENILTAETDNESARFPVFQKYWDFDTRLNPIVSTQPIPIPGPIPLPADNDGTISDIPILPYNVPVDYFSYDYKYDSRILTFAPHEPIFAYTQPGIYRITFTGSYADKNGFVIKMETATRIIQVLPAITTDQDNDGAIPPDNDGTL